MKEHMMPEEEEARTGDGRYKPGQSGNPRGRPLGAKDKDRAVLADLLREYLEESQTVERGKGKEKHLVLMKCKEVFIRSVLASAIKGNVATQRLVFNYADGLPRLSVSLEGRLVNLDYDLPLNAEDEKAYGEVLGQFFPGGAGLEELAAGRNPGVVGPEFLREQARREEEDAPLFARLKALRDAGIDIWSDEMLERSPPPAGDPPDDGPEIPDDDGEP